MSTSIRAARVWAISIFALLFSATTFADNSASAFRGDGTAVIGIAAADAGVMDENGYVRILSTELKNSGTPKDLVIGLSFETSLFTQTVVKSKGGKQRSRFAKSPCGTKRFTTAPSWSVDRDEYSSGSARLGSAGPGCGTSPDFLYRRTTDGTSSPRSSGVSVSLPA